MTTNNNPAHQTRKLAVYSSPEVPDGLIGLSEWAESKNLTHVCAHRWVQGGKLLSYRVPGYGRKSFVVSRDADKLLTPVAICNDAITK